MKKLTASLLLFSVVITSLSAQTINPSCFSNAQGWTITRIEHNSEATLVHLQFYTYKSNYKFFINPGMYIEQYNNTTSSRYYVTSFDGYEINKSYSTQPFTTYNFVLRFQRIPGSWSDINIVEPATAGYTAWYWKYISLNRPESERLKIDDFTRKIAADFCETFAHPTNTLKKFTYSVTKNSANLTLYFQNQIVTDLQFKLDGKLISDVSIIYDNDSVYPFSLLKTIKDWINAFDDDESLSTMVLENMSGTQLAAAALTLLWNTME